MRTDVTSEDESLIAMMYVNKNRPASIAVKTGYSEKKVKEILEDNQYMIEEMRRSKKSKLSMQDKELNVISLYKRGYEPENIHKILNISFPSIWNILNDYGITQNGCSPKFANIDKLNEFINTVNIGDKYKIVAMRDAQFDNITGTVERVITIEVFKKYPHFVMTNNGDFNYFDLYTGQKVK